MKTWPNHSCGTLTLRQTAVRTLLRRDRRRRGVTLAEALAGMAVMSVVVLALGSAMLLASHAVPDGTGPVDIVLAAGTVADDLAADLRYALSFMETSALAAEFIVPDRQHGDPGPELIRYAWSGTPGDPLTRQYNGGSVIEIAEDVHEFQLSYDLSPGSWVEPPTDNESAETTLFNYDSALFLSVFELSAEMWAGEYFKPTLPGGAIGWKVTRVKFVARRGDVGVGATAVQLRTPDASNEPTSTIIDEWSLPTATLTGSFLWHEAPFTKAKDLPPDRGLCLVFATQGQAPCELQYQSASVTLPNAAFLFSDTGGGAWSSTSNEALLFYVYGTVTTMGEPTIVEVDYLLRVGVSLRIGEHPVARVDTGVSILNVPEVTGP